MQEAHVRAPVVCSDSPDTCSRLWGIRAEGKKVSANSFISIPFCSPLSFWTRAATALRGSLPFRLPQPPDLSSKHISLQQIQPQQPFGDMDFVEFYPTVSVLSPRQILQCCSSYHKVITWPFFRPVWIHGWNSLKRLRSQKKIKSELSFSQLSWLHTRWSQQLEKSDRQLGWVYQMVNWSLSCLPKSLGIKTRSIFHWH